PGLFIRDPELIKHICIKDSLHFKSRDSNIENIELSSSKPNFSSDTIKQFFSIFDEIGNNLNRFLSDLTAANGVASTNIKEICEFFTTEIILKVVLQADSKDEKLRNYIKTLSSSNFLKNMHSIFVFFAPNLAKMFKKQSKTSENEFKASSAALSFSLYELAMNAEIQDNLREEIKNVLSENEGLVTYEVINSSMPYLDKVVNEVFRLYPAKPIIVRELSLLDGEDSYNSPPPQKMSSKHHQLRYRLHSMN
uniref:Cytochrome P450 n=1 Tax=Megaselia scalaris TaxID=36166 RepID=T1GY89_MEGSC